MRNRFKAIISMAIIVCTMAVFTQQASKAEPKPIARMQNFAAPIDIELDLVTGDTGYYLYNVSTQTVTITQNGAYTLKTSDGAVTNRKVVVNNGLQVELILDRLNSKQMVGSALHLKSGSTVDLTIKDGTENFLEAANVLYDNACGIFSEGANLTISGNGKLTARGGASGAGIGSTAYNIPAGNITIHSGEIYAYGGGSSQYAGPGIGQGGSYLGNDTATNNTVITITGGKIYAEGGYGNYLNTIGAGIGGGSGASVGTVIISGGEITAVGKSAGIGNGKTAHTEGQITISGGIINATGGSNSAGIGGYFGRASDTNKGMHISISGGTINATGGSGSNYGDGGPGIGIVSQNGSITITGGIITAKGSSNGGAGIGGYSGMYGGPPGKITINESTEPVTITATGTVSSAGIGAGGGTHAGGSTVNQDILISGGDITAIGAGAGIGAGASNGSSGAWTTTYASAGKITIEGGNIYARSTQKSAGIGGGSVITTATTGGEGGIVTISGGNVTAIGGPAGGAGIGSGDAKIALTGSELTIDKTATVRAFSANKPALHTTNLNNNGSEIVIHGRMSAPLSSTQDIGILAFDENRRSLALPEISLPAAYRSFAFDVPNRATYYLKADFIPPVGYASNIVLVEKDGVPQVLEIDSGEVFMPPQNMQLEKLVKISYAFSHPAASGVINPTFGDIHENTILSNASEILIADPAWRLTGWTSSFDGKRYALGSTHPTATLSDGRDITMTANWLQNHAYFKIAYYYNTTDPTNLIAETMSNQLYPVGMQLSEADIAVDLANPNWIDAYRPSGGEAGEVQSYPQITLDDDANIIHVVYKYLPKPGYGTLRLEFYLENNSNLLGFLQTNKFLIGTEITPELLAETFGADWLNTYKPNSGYQDGEIYGSYPVITDGEIIISIVYPIVDIMVKPEPENPDITEPVPETGDKRINSQLLIIIFSLSLSFVIIFKINKKKKNV